MRVAVEKSGSKNQRFSNPQSAIQILEAKNRGPHIWGLRFGVMKGIFRTGEPFVHNERQLSTDLRELSTVWELIHRISRPREGGKYGVPRWMTGQVQPAISPPQRGQPHRPRRPLPPGRSAFPGLWRR